MLVVDACPETDALLADRSLADADLRLEWVADAREAVRRMESGDPVDVVLLAPRLADPVRVAQRLHSLDRTGAVVILATLEREPEIRHSLEVAPFLEGDVTCVALPAAGVAQVLADAAERTRLRRAAAFKRWIQR